MPNIIIAPLATPANLSRGAEQAIRSAQSLFLQTDKHPSAAWVTREGLQYRAMDDLYNASEDFDALSAAIAARLTESATQDVVYAVPGRGIGQAQLQALHTQAQAAGFGVVRLPSTGYCEAALCAISAQDVVLDSVLICAAQALDASVLNPRMPLCVEELDTQIRAGEVKLLLGEFYPDTLPLWLCTMDASGVYHAQSIPLYELDRQPASAYFAATVLILPAVGLEQRERFDTQDLMAVMRRLRAPGGCPWDAEQTHGSLKQPLLEESYEVLDALIQEDMDALCEELGDLLLQIAFHAVIEEEKSAFTLRDVTTGIVRKLIYRHPHVFGDVSVSSADEVLTNWDALKMTEKHYQTQSDSLDAVPNAFPALMRSAKVQSRAAKVGFDWDTPLEALAKVFEEAEESREALSAQDKFAIAEELGDLLFACVNVVRLAKQDPELLLNTATDKFRARFRQMEALALQDSKSLSGMSLQDMDVYWERTK